jgi:predicted phage-related endonuclease
LSPYQTEFELYHQKKEKHIVRLTDNERMLWGRNLESAIAHGAADTMGWEIYKFDDYLSNSETRMGSSFDYKITKSNKFDQPDDGVGILEIKNVDGVAYRKNWKDDGNGNIEAPEHIELQIQHQMEVADIKWCALVALVGGNTQKIIFRKRDRAIGEDLTKKVGEFWKKVKAGTPPSIDYLKDAEYMIKTLHNQADAGVILDADEDLDKLIDEYNMISKEAHALGKTKDSIKAQILERSQKASRIISKYGTISCGMSKESKGKLITKDMVGTYQSPRKGYRMFRFTSTPSSI